MTIETSSNQGANRSPAASESKGASSKQSSVSDSSGGGFMAVLASVETPASAQTPVPAADTVATLTLGKNTGGKNQIKAKTTTGADAKNPDPAAVNGAGTVDVNAKVLTDVAQVLADPSAAATAAALNLLIATDPAAADIPLDGAALLAQSVAWGSSAKGEVGSDGGLVPTTAPTVGMVANANGGRQASVASAPIGAASLVELPSEQLAAGALKAAKVQVDAKTKPLLVTAAVNAAVASDSKNTLAVSQKLADIQMAPLATAIVNANTNVGIGVITSMLREEPPRERSVFRANSADGAFSPQAISTPAPTLTVSGAPEVIATTDAYVADKVSYWISNNIQNAEMTLDGVGDHPVEVSIRMQGNEAHVAFRTDELQTRAALEHASAHLKDMLQREGLVLSGVSVGTAGTGESGSQDRKSRQGEQQTTVTTLQPIGGDLRTALNRVTSGGLDLFV